MNYKESDKKAYAVPKQTRNEFGQTARMRKILIAFIQTQK